MTAPEYKQGQRDEIASHATQIGRLRRWLLAVALLAACGPVAGAVGFRVWRAQAEANCRSIHGIVVAGGNLIGTPEQIRERFERGEISREMRDAALGWYAADCPKATATPTPTPS